MNLDILKYLKKRTFSYQISIKCLNNDVLSRVIFLSFDAIYNLTMLKYYEYFAL